MEGKKFNKIKWLALILIMVILILISPFITKIFVKSELKRYYKDVCEELEKNIKNLEEDSIELEYSAKSYIASSILIQDDAAEVCVNLIMPQEIFELLEFTQSDYRDIARECFEDVDTYSRQIISVNGKEVYRDDSYFYETRDRLYEYDGDKVRIVSGAYGKLIGELWIIVIAVVIIGTIVISIAIFIVLAIVVSKNDKQQKKKLIEELKLAEQQVQYDKKCIELYEYYIDNGYDVKDEKTNKIIADTKNIAIEEIEAMYNHGKEELIKQEAEEAEAELEEKREEENKNWEKSKELTNSIYKEKYITVINNRIQALDAMQKMAGIMQDAYISGAVQARNVRKTDPYIIGGMANGIAGPAAGMMEANRIARNNAKREAEAKITSEASIKSAVKWGMMEKQYKTPLEKLTAAKEVFEQALIDKDIEVAKSNLKITALKCKLLDTKNFVVSFNLKTNNTTLLNKDALVDGVLKINVLDENNNIVANGYHTGNNISIDNSNEIDMTYGFENGSVIVYCKTLDYEKIDMYKNYTAQIEHENIWLIEDV